MEMQRINENTIRVILGNEDLEARGITVLDLLGNHKQIESFFYSILEEVDKDHSFASNDAVTFQVMPNKDGLELLISKNISDEDKDNDSSALNEHNDDEVSNYIKQQLLQHDDDLTNDDSISDDDDMDEMDTYLNDPDTPTYEVVLKLQTFEEMISLAKTLRLENAISNLYRLDNAYYLDLIFFINEIPEATIKDDLAIAYEYSEKTRITPDVLSEYGEKIMDKSALELTRYYFK